MDKYCKRCGKELFENVKYCPNCGTEVIHEETINNHASHYQQSVSYGGGSQNKSKIAAGLLGIFLGYLGVHNFYLGYNGKAIAQLLLTLVGWLACGIGPVVASIWGLVEGILILVGSIHQDANGNPLND